MSTATETDLEERLRHDTERSVEIAEHKARTLLSSVSFIGEEEDDVTTPALPEGAVPLFTFDTEESADDGFGSDGDVALIFDTGTFIKKEGGTWESS